MKCRGKRRRTWRGGEERENDYDNNDGPETKTDALTTDTTACMAGRRCVRRTCGDCFFVWYYANRARRVKYDLTVTDDDGQYAKSSKQDMNKH